MLLRPTRQPLQPHSRVQSYFKLILAVGEQDEAGRDTPPFWSSAFPGDHSYTLVQTTLCRNPFIAMASQGILAVSVTKAGRGGGRPCGADSASRNRTKTVGATEHKRSKWASLGTGVTMNNGIRPHRLNASTLLFLVLEEDKVWIERRAGLSVRPDHRGALGENRR